MYDKVNNVDENYHRIMPEQNDVIKKSLKSIYDDLIQAETGPDRNTFGFKHRLQVIHENLDELEPLIVSEYSMGDLNVLEPFGSLHYSRGDSGMAQFLKSRIKNLAIRIGIDLEDKISFTETKKIEDNNNSLSQLENLLNKFHDVEIQLQKRREGRSTLIINDEYDIQDLLHALLKIHFDDVRAEDAQPTYAGGNSFIDFLIPSIKAGIECKKTRKNLKDKQLGDELIIDIKRYNKRIDCKVLYCLIHDTEHFLENPDGLRIDLEKVYEGLQVKLIFIQ